MGREMSGLRTMEHVCGGSGAQGAYGGEACGTWHRRSTLETAMSEGNRVERRAAHRHARRGTEPSARRGTGGRLAHADRRRTGHREIDPRAADRAPAHRQEGALHIGRRKQPPTEATCRPYPPLRQCRPAHRLRDIAGADFHAHQECGARPGGHRLDTDHLHRKHRLIAGQHRAGARVFGRHPEIRERDGHTGHPDRTHQQGRKSGRPESAGAHRGHGASV